MIPFASQRGGGQDLATHLLNDYDNDLAEVDQVRGAVARDLHGAFKEWQVQAETLTKCENYLYSLSINPDQRQGPLTRDQYMDYIGRTEQALGLSEQPRAVVFHVKNGREHCHVVWSRIDADREKAVHLAYDRDKLMQVTRSFARDHGLTLPTGYEKSRHKGQETLYEREQQRRTGLTKDDHKREVTQAWRHSDTPKAFVQALAERGYLLATGDKPYVVVDSYGGMHSLPKLIDDKAVNTKQVRAFLDKDFPVESLPSVEEAQELVEAHRKLTEKSIKEEQRADRLDALKHFQQDRRRPLEQERDALKQKQHTQRLEQQAKQRAERDRLRSNHIETMKAARHKRDENRPTGLAAFLGKVTGITLIQNKLHQRQDARKVREFVEQRAQLKSIHAQEQRQFDLRLKLQVQEMERKLKALDRVDNREQVALARDGLRDQRVRDRGDGNAMPSLETIVGLENKAKENEAPDLLSAFERAKQGQQKDVPDLMAVFERAAKSKGEGDADGGAGKGLDKVRPSDFNMQEHLHKNVERGIVRDGKPR